MFSMNELSFSPMRTHPLDRRLTPCPPNLILQRSFRATYIVSGL
jgi:hypothetical protein